MRRLGLTAAVGGLIGVAMPSAATAQQVLKVSTGKPYGTAQTNTITSDPAVDGKILQVTVNKAGVKPWDAGINSFIGEKLKAGDRVEVTMWLRASQTEPGQAPTVAATLQDNGPPRVEFAKAQFSLTGRWAPYKFTAVIPANLPAHKAMIGLQVAFAMQTVDVAAVTASLLPPEG